MHCDALALVSPELPHVPLEFPCGTHTVDHIVDCFLLFLPWQRMPALLLPSCAADLPSSHELLDVRGGTLHLRCAACVSKHDWQQRQ
jgi:hypothetical protein